MAHRVREPGINTRNQKQPQGPKPLRHSPRQQTLKNFGFLR